jgi:hypothetical protein
MDLKLADSSGISPETVITDLHEGLGMKYRVSHPPMNISSYESCQ